MSLSPSGNICVCPGKQIEFMCQVSGQNYYTPPQINWLIQFKAPGLSDVQLNYLSEDPLGTLQTDYRNGYYHTFKFNLTDYYRDNNISILTSTLMITSMSTISTLNQATVNCNQEQNEEAAMLDVTICTLSGKQLAN